MPRSDSSAGEDRGGPPPTAAEGADLLDRFLADSAAEVEAFLDRSLPAPNADSTLPEAIRHAALGGGKRLRPAVAMAAAVAMGGPAERALPAAAAIEMIHTYSLIHDDLPCMDDDDWRRGRATVHVAYGEAVAVLAGDSLQAQAFEILAGASGNSPASPAVRLESVRRLALAAGARGMVGGQALDIEAENRPPDAVGLEAIHRGKTGALLGAAAALGALAGGGDREQVEEMDRAGAELGLVFQIVDDLLDEESTTAALGKSAGKDRAAGKATYPALHGVAAARSEAERRTRRAQRRLREIPRTQPEGIGLLCLLADRLLHRRA